MTMVELTVQDMTCGHCAATITEAVKAVDPAGRCEIDVPARRLTRGAYVLVLRARDGALERQWRLRVID